MVTFSFLWLAWIAALALPVTIFVVEIIASTFTAPGRRQIAPTNARPTFAVLMPAHNEAAGISVAIGSVRSQLGAGDRLLVVADNCSDATADVARGLGAEVVERFDDRLRGKGFALDFGMRHLAAHPPEMVVIVDADCQLEPGSLQVLAATCAHTGRPVQALYLMKSPQERGATGRMAEFAWRVKNHARPLGLHQLGLPCQLMGTGMAFPWLQLSRAPLASGHIVEDLQLGIDLARDGFAPRFCPEAGVTSYFAANAEGAKNQRTRWEHGHLQMIFSRAPRAIGSALAKGNMGLLALGLDLLVPPLALLCMAVMGSALVSLMLAIWQSAFLLHLFAAIAVALLLAIGVMLAWAGFGRDLLTSRDLLYAPFYALRKLPLYLKFLFARQVNWVRAKRDE